MRLSIITSLYYSEPYLNKFYQRTISAIAEIPSIGNDFELILVNDGSPDNSLSVAQTLARQDSHVRVIDLSRNFGHHKALMTGLKFATGDFAFIIDCDLEEDPSLLNSFWQRLQENPSYDAVFGVQANRKGGWFERLSGKCFYWLFNSLAEPKIVENQLIARLLTRRYYTDLLRFTESQLIFAGICKLVGYEQLAVPVNKSDKKSTSYVFLKRLKLAVDMITSYSSKPLELVFYSGIMVSICSFVALSFIVYCKLVLNTRVEGWSFLGASIWLIGGIVILSQGLVGIYIARIYEQTKQRPFTLVRSDSAIDFNPIGATDDKIAKIENKQNAHFQHHSSLHQIQHGSQLEPLKEPGVPVNRSLSAPY
ncbi:MAG: glycosyltransferase family 2 protein [Candidatus Obscuribacterales bacterium]|jgi:putative glycosyltransferase|nr:glycosyltransferase family 2 protein [Candidatus Obscuribacterales bacterium]